VGHGGGGLERGRMLARLGLRPGWPDVQVMHPVPAAAACLLLGLELKTPIGRQSLVQKQVEADFAAAGAVYRLCRSIDDVERVLRMVGVPVYAHARAA
jgi:hypothetical protein